MTHLNSQYIPKDIFSLPLTDSGLCRDFLLATEQYHSELSLRELPRHRFDEQVLENFSKLPMERQKMLVRVLKDLCELLQESISEPIFPEKVSIEKEISYLSHFLKKLNLKISSADFLDQLENGELIEIYDLEGIQLYRSWSAFQFCSYSIDQLMTYDWNTLFERPSHVVSYLYSVLPEIFSSGKTVHYSIEEYLIKERFAQNSKTFLYKMKKASAIVDQTTLQPRAFVTTATGRMVEVAEKNKISFI